MRPHPQIGERLFRAVPRPGGGGRDVLHQAEGYDGAGYPDGVSGGEIPHRGPVIPARGAFHAMTSDRPYRAAMPDADAFRELRAGAGSQFDPEVVELLGELLDGGRLTVLALRSRTLPPG